MGKSASSQSILENSRGSLFVTAKSIKNGLVVLLDALGVSQFNLEECKDFVRKRDEVRRVASQSYLLGLQNNNNNQLKLKNNLKPTISAIFGDTLLYAWDFDDRLPSKPVALKFLALWLAHILWNGIERQILYRGAMSFGEILIDKKSQTVIGPAVADAAEWYEQADWFGVVITPSCGIGIDYFEFVKENHMGNNGDVYIDALKDIGIDTDTLKISMLEDLYSSAMVRYCVPLKGDKTGEMWAISWPYAACCMSGNTAGNKCALDAKLKLLSSLDTLPKLLPKGSEQKISNSLKFFDHCQMVNKK
ncbi:MAG: hypothetical protein ACYDC8_00325 [Gammaproteobacteria bacterium]